MVMKVLVITGSPHRKGTSALVAEKFIEGASEMGAQINRFDAAFANVHPCMGCDVCQGNRLHKRGKYEYDTYTIFIHPSPCKRKSS